MSKVDSEFILGIASLHKELRQNNEKENKDLSFVDFVNKQMKETIPDPIYLSLETKLKSLDDEEWLDFLAVYYLGKGTYTTYRDARENVKHLGPHNINQMIKKGNLAKYLVEGDQKR
ncbi:MAG: DUF3775 domain-containing protein [Ignavibacteriales bacterium]|nr:DUF3775 domain-containing protein [Ignavibacteriales bacterium]